MARVRTDSPPLFTDGPAAPDDRFERALARSGCACICGVDEAGRGPLAGPVVAAAVILDAGTPVNGLADSKVLTPVRRAELFDAIMAGARGVAIASRCAATIDRSDIRKASLEAMRGCICAITPHSDGALCDGRDVPENLPPALLARALVGGDGLSVSVAAASIVAKVTRDRMMERLCGAHPHYGFSAHKGYSVASHRVAIGLHGGVERIHRFSFRPLAAHEKAAPKGAA
ncbi:MULTISPECIES: ribonuclease HII [unclassified Roseitalea]|uniref:ribonuclease HII n=1 Tax=unclassified Roseitalea TaxID=2639107 RepID=UPI00273E3160|nr:MULTISPECIES: ribonuclease HII [unclassified Roseitalea]